MVIERYLPIWGGAENQLRQLIPFLNKRGCTVEIVTRRWHNEMPKKELIDGVQVHRLGLTGSSAASTLIFIFFLLLFLLTKGRHFDLFHSHGAVKMGVLCRMAGWCLTKPNIVKIATAGHVTKLAGNWQSSWLIPIFKSSSAIIAMTDEIEEELKSQDVSEQVVKRIANGVNCSRFSPLPLSQKIQWKKENNIGEESEIVLFSSRLVPRKGLDVLIEAWSLVGKKYPEVFLLILGSGKNQPDSIEELMKNKVAEKRFENVRFLGETSTPELYLGLADVFVFPSRQEGFPNALMEAMATGLPVLGSHIGGVTDLVEDKKTGFLFTPESSSDLADNIVSLLHDAELCEKTGQQARKNVLDNYSFETISARYMDVYLELATKK